MAVDSNGLAAPGKKGGNGQMAVRSKSKSTGKKQKGLGLFGIVARLLTWYSIVTILFRCPQNVDHLRDDNPKICKPYFQLRSTIAPHLEPYYEKYVADYVDAARPYYSTLDNNIITPTTALAQKYGAPRMAQLQGFGQAQWDKNVHPRATKYQALLSEKYGETLKPHVDSLVEVTSPYLEIARANAQQTYHEQILPSYKFVKPYAILGYGMASEFTINTAVPYSQWAWTNGMIFLDRTVWPRVRILYGENVEPQLVRIGERLGRYRDGKKLKAAVEEIDISSSASSASKSLSSISSSVSSAHATTAESSSSETSMSTSSPKAKETSVTKEEIKAKAQEIVTNDLKTWQEKFTKAADEGSAELDDRITEITDRILKKQAKGVGKALVIELEETIGSSLRNLKIKVTALVKDGKDESSAEDALKMAVRKAGISIKEKAQAVRTWRRSVDGELNSLVSKASEDTFEIIDHIRDLGLQEIGMRWAWTDGITHKHWTQYHELKTKFAQWRGEVEKVATEHPGLKQARASSKDVEGQAMDIAEDAAKELAQVKETAIWKLSTGDASDDWSSKLMPAAAANVGHSILDKVSAASEAVAGTSKDSIKPIATSASSSVEKAASAGSSIASSQIEKVKNAGMDGSSSASSVVSAASSIALGKSQENVQNIATGAKASVSSVIDQASSSIVGTQQGTLESFASVASESASSLSARASGSVNSQDAGVAGKAASIASESISSASNAASSVISSMSESVASLSHASASTSASNGASKKVWGGAEAQFVEARQIIFEDIIEEPEDGDSFSEKLQSMASEAGDRYADITQVVSEAFLKPTAASGRPFTKLAAEQYSNALVAASIALYGAEQGTNERISSIASSRYAEAVSAARVVIYGTPAPLTDAIATQATAAYSAALSRASDHYANARSLVSAQISGEPKPVHEEMFSSVELAYSEATGAAYSRLQSALSGASSAVYGTPTASYQSALSSMSSVAQSKLSEGLSQASARLEDGKSYVAAINTESPHKQKLLNQMREQYYAGIGMAHAQYSEFVDAASSAVLPRSTPLHESLYSKASAGIVGTSTNQFEAAMNTASASLASAIAVASSQMDIVLESVTNWEGEKDVSTSTLASIASSRYREAVSKASESFESAQSAISKKLDEGASGASSLVIGSETPWTESAASVASENWEALITKASSQIYGGPTPYFVTRKLLSEAREYAAQATDGAASQYSAVQSLISDLVSGKEPDFTESVYNRFSSAYHTGAGALASSASSYASEAYESASSVVGSVFTPPPTLEAILDNASNNVNEVIENASIQFYGSEKGYYEQATEAASSAYSSVQSAASDQMYGTKTGYAEAAQSSIADAASSAQKAISEAIYGTETGVYESATSIARDQYDAAQSAVNSAFYGQEKGALESAQSRLSAAVESANLKLAEFASAASHGAGDAATKASERVEDFTSGVSSAFSEVTGRLKDEL